MKIHIQSYHSNSYLWEHIVENILTYSNLNVTIITDKNPGLKIKGVEIIECGGGTWQETMLNFLDYFNDDFIFLSFDDLFLTKEFYWNEKIMDVFQDGYINSLKLAHIFKSKKEKHGVRYKDTGRYLTTCAFVIWKVEKIRDLLGEKKYTPWSFEELGHLSNQSFHASFSKRRISYINVVDKGKVSFFYRHLADSKEVKSLMSSTVYILRERIKYLLRMLNI